MLVSGCWLALALYILDLTSAFAYQLDPPGPCATSLSFLGDAKIPLLEVKDCGHASFGKVVGGIFEEAIHQRLATPSMGVLRVCGSDEEHLSFGHLPGSLN